MFPRRIELVLQGIILLSLVSYACETLPNLTTFQANVLHVAELSFIAIFTVEYFWRLATAEAKLRFVFSFFGLVDLFAILPFYLSFGIDLKAIRGIRLLRLFRLLKLARYSKAIRRFHKALILAKEELVLFASASLIVLFLSAVGIYHFEHEAQPEIFASVFHSLWWSIVTLTTVGYGDVLPVTIGGRIFTFLVLVVGLGIVAVPSGIVASALNEARKSETPTSLDIGESV